MVYLEYPHFRQTILIYFALIVFSDLSAVFFLFSDFSIHKILGYFSFLNSFASSRSLFLYPFILINPDFVFPSGFGFSMSYQPLLVI